MAIIYNHTNPRDTGLDLKIVTKILKLSQKYSKIIGAFSDIVAAIFNRCNYYAQNAEFEQLDLVIMPKYYNFL